MKTKVLRYLCLAIVLLCFLSTTLPIVQAWYTNNGNTIVYVTATGDKYHSVSCGYLKSKYKTTLLEALIDGYSPCSRCDPPIYTGVVPTQPIQSSEKTTDSGNTYGSSSSSGSSGETTSPHRPSSSTSSNLTVSPSGSSTDSTLTGILLAAIGIALVSFFAFRSRKHRALYFSLIFAVLLLSLEIWIYLANYCSFTGGFSFQCMHNRNTGEPISVFLSVFLYFLLAWFVSLMPILILNLFPMMLPYLVLYLTDKYCRKNTISQSDANSMEFYPQLSYLLGLAAAFIIVFLHAFGVITHI